MSIYRRLPNSDPARLTALQVAAEMHAATGADSVLTSKTAGRLLDVYPAYEAGSEKISLLEGNSILATKQKLVAQNDCMLFAKHGFLTIMMAVERGVMDSHVFPFYNLTEQNPVLPPLIKEQDVVTAAQNFINGEKKRVAEKGEALTFPSAVEVKTRLDAYSALLKQQSLAQIALKDAQDELHALNAEADAVIKKVWDEVDTYYNDKADETRRDYCRKWGVVYVSDVRIPLTGVVLRVVNGQAVAVENAEILLVQSDEKIMAGANGIFELMTGFAGEGTVQISAPGLVTRDITVTLDGKEPLNLGEITLEEPAATPAEPAAGA